MKASARMASWMLATLIGIGGCGENDGGEPDLCDQTPTGQVTLPADDGGHDEPVEWWYWTGHLEAVAEPGRWFGFEVAIFHFQAPLPMRLYNIALTDIDGQVFHFDGLPEFGEVPEVPAGGFDLNFDAVQATGGDGIDHLHGTVGDWELDLDLTAIKPPVLQHGNGYTDYDFGGYTYYYSRSRMETVGTLTSGQDSFAVQGLSWFDHQWGDLTPITEKGWDWFALQLDDQREIMLFLVHGTDEIQFLGGTITDAQCRSEEIAPESVTVTAHKQWQSAATDCSYPMGWDISIGDLNLTVSPVLDDQELASSHNPYWEGAALVTGDATGRAYVELNGYCD